MELSCFDKLTTTFSPWVIVLKYPLGPPNMFNQNYIIWDYINIIINNTPGEIYKLILHNKGNDKIPKELYEFIGHYAKKSQNPTVIKLIPRPK